MILAVVCVQQGAEETPDEDNKEGAPEESGSTGVALSQRGKENKFIGASAAAGAANQKGGRKIRRGEPIF